MMSVEATAIIVVLIIVLLYCIIIEPYSEVKAPIRIWDMNSNFKGYPKQLYAPQYYAGL